MARAQVASRSLDATVAAGLAGLGVAEVVVPFTTVMGQGSAVLAGALAITTSLSLILRRRWPLAVLAAVMVPWAVLAMVVPTLVLFWGGLMPMCVATYSGARYAAGRLPFVAAGLSATALFAFSVGTGMTRDPGQLYFPWLMLIAAWLTGWFIHRRDLAVRTSEQHALLARARSHEQTELALAEERARIARELHDIVAHTLTAIVVQAGAARDVVDEDPEYVRDCLDRIRETGSDALDDMRRVVTLVREPGDPEPGAPQPGLAELDHLVAQANSASTAVSLRVEGQPRPLTPGADLAAYRIVQESLTNAHRHAAATEVRVTVTYHPDSVEIDVSDNGRGIATPAVQRHGGGHGLVGVRERATMYGGQVFVTSTPRAGYRLRAVLPLPGPT